MKYYLLIQQLITPALILHTQEFFYRYSAFSFPNFTNSEKLLDYNVYLLFTDKFSTCTQNLFWFP